MKQLTDEDLLLLDAKIKSGQMSSVQIFLEELDALKVPRAQLAPLANIARRVGFHRYALSLLCPILRSKEPLRRPPTDVEKFEYAAALIRAGALNEANSLLLEIDPERNPVVFFHRAILKIQTWNYVQAIPFLIKYAERIPRDDYQYLIGKTNLAECYLFTDTEEKCVALLDELFALVNPKQHTLLYGKLLEMKARLFFNQKKWDEALNVLEKAKANTDKNHFRYSYYLEQMQASINLLKNPNEKTIAEMARLQKKAGELRLWEMRRDCDLTLALATNNIDLYQRLYFGTPHSTYRERLIKSAKLDKFTWPEHFDYRLGDGPSQGVLDIENAVDLNSKAKLKHGSIVHRLLKILASDFYLSLRAESLFSVLFPDEYFNPRKFHNRVHNVLARLRRWFREHNIPLDIQEYYEEYRLVALAPYTLRVGANAPVKDSYDYLINLIRTEFPSKEFSSSEVTNVISISFATSKRVLSEALEKKIVSRVGKGRATRYRFSA